MTNEQFKRAIVRRNQLVATIKGLQIEVDELEAEMKSEMIGRSLEEMLLDEFIVRYKSILSSRFDTKRFKEEIGEDVYKEYCKEVASMRFTIG